MKNYKVLNQQEFSNGAFSIVPIRFEDRIQIMHWRNEQIYHLRQEKPLTETDQTNYFNSVVNSLFEQDQPNQLLFSFLENGVCIGYGGLVHINWIDKNAEISFIMDTKLEEANFSSNWKMFLSLIELVAFENLDFHKILTYAYDVRPHLYSVLEETNYLEDARLKDHCFFRGEYVDVLIHSKINPVHVSLRKATEEDLGLVFNWSNDKVVREQSFSSDQIKYEDHVHWYNAKLTSEDDLLFIVEYSSKPAGLIRFSKQTEHAIVGILLGSEFRGKGLAKKILIQSSKKCLRIWGLPIHAHIKEDNIASIKSFKNAGYSLLGKEAVNGINSNIYIFKG